MEEIREDFDSEKLYFFIFKFICFKIQFTFEFIYRVYVDNVGGFGTRDTVIDSRNKCFWPDSFFSSM